MMFIKIAHSKSTKTKGGEKCLRKKMAARNKIVSKSQKERHQAQLMVITATIKVTAQASIFLIDACFTKFWQPSRCF